VSIEWREINKDYMISSDGQVVSRKRLKPLKMTPVINSDGYPQVLIYTSGKRLTRPVHRLVAEAFLPPRPTPTHQVNHRNGIRTDNRAENLEWVTGGENIRHSFRVLGKKAARGEAKGNAKLTETQVREIRSRWAAREAQKKIAADYGVSQTLISRIALGKAWAWMGGL